MNLLINCVSDFCIDDVRSFVVDQVLYDGNDTLVDGFTLFVSENYVNFKLCSICDNLVDKDSESNTSRTIVSDKIN